MNYENFLDETKQLWDNGENFLNEGKFADAVECFEQAVKVQEDKYGAEHESTVACMTELGMSVLVSGDFAKAKIILDKTLANALKIYTHECQEVGNLYYLLGTTDMQLNNLDDASDDFQNLYNISSKLYGNDAKETQTALACYNKVMAEMGGSDEEKKKIAEMTDELECYNMGNKCFSGEDTYLAPNYLKRAIELREADGNEDNTLVEYYRALAVAYTELDLSKEALETLTKLLDMAKKLNGDNDISVSGTYNLIGYNHMVRAEYDEAIACLNKCISIDIKIYGEKSIEVLRDYNILASMYRLADQIDKSIATYVIIENLAAMTEAEGARDILLSVYTDLAALYMQSEKYNEAHDYIHKKLHLCMHIFGKVSPQTYETYNQLLSVASHMGDDEEIAEVLKAIDEIREAAGEEMGHHDDCGCGCHDHEHHHHDDDCDCGCHDHHHDDDCCCGHDHNEA